MSGDASDLENVDDEGIADQMDEVRSKLGGGIERLNEDMRHVFDWQAYVRSAPLTSVGIAAAVGYLLAPAIIRSSRAPQTIQMNPSDSQGGIFSTLSSLAFGSIVRVATGYVTDMLTSAPASPAKSEPSRAPGSPPEQTFD